MKTILFCITIIIYSYVMNEFFDVSREYILLCSILGSLFAMAEKNN